MSPARMKFRPCWRLTHSVCVVSALIACVMAEAEDTPYYVMASDGTVTVRTASQLVARLVDPDPQARLSAALLLQYVHALDSRQTIAPLIRLLDDPVEAVRNQASETLSYVGLDAVPALIDVVKGQGATSGRHDTSVRLQRLAVETLGSLAWRSEDAKQALLDIIQDPRIHTVVRYSAFGGLGRLGTGAPGVAPILIDLMKRTNEDLSLRQAAIMTLEALGPGPTTIEVLGQLLSDGNVHIRQSAAYALRRFGLAAKAALPQLQAALTDSDSEVRLSAAAAMKELTGHAP